ncbi:hypothetical protein SPHINGO391_470078 [Sphingomonas aurantiaca]|uniref:Uncharacterized protein n=1 Tax=Sphingomonas aurantiaca TaxID=185949 RepID=A0A5E7ZTQ8_9SPHN|nr:hypothetical protein [Sphingomonas aurantiaca]VVT20515.1 hypothetical protein SPHINGO391_470078 [Sphingomonas aurantiaca]
MAQDIPQLIASARGFLTSQAYAADERPVLIAIVDQLEKTHAALKPFATAQMEDAHGEKLAEWHAQHDSDGVTLNWDPDFENGSTLTIGQFKRAHAAFQGEA